MTTVETRVVNPVTNSSTVQPVGVTETQMVEAAIQRDEETMIADEEINSCEAEDLEDKMLTVALVKSVVETGGIQASGENARKRRRPGDVEVGNHASSESTPETSALHQLQYPVPDPMRNPVASAPPSVLPVPAGAIVASAAPPPVSSVATQRPPGSAVVAKTEQQPSLSGSSSSRGGAVAVRQLPIAAPIAQAPPVLPIIPQPAKPIMVAPKPEPKRKSTSNITKKPARKSSTKSSTKSQKAKKVTLKVPPNATQLRRDPLAPTSGAVPNPLLPSTPDLPILPKTDAIKKEVVQQSQAGVPCPLPAPVPCPLGPGAPAVAPEQSVSNASANMSPPPPKRGRIFSVDLDPSTFDFTDMVSDYDKADSADGPDASAGSHPPDLAIFQRERAFSFEVFNFSGDDLLPPPPPPAAHSAASELPVPGPPIAPEPEIPSVVSRPRGDSIIFDPVSFQDGGIHEKNALLKVKATNNVDGPPAGLLADSKLAAPQPEPEPKPSHSNTPNPLPPFTVETPTAPANPSSSSELATLPSALSNNAANASSPATFQMELLNKDGRIGIYLPEARRQRIARFHAKRKMRIWRKRIKYDCRKKLADSRPRIKGRFVKRSDMDDE